MFKVYDLLGRQVAEQDLGGQQGGIVVVHWDPRESSGKPLASGLYLGVLEGRTRSRPQKLVYLQ